MPRRNRHYAYVVPMRRRPGPLLLALACGLFGFLAGTGLGLGLLAATAFAVVGGGLTYALATRD